MNVAMKKSVAFLCALSIFGAGSQALAASAPDESANAAIPSSRVAIIREDVSHQEAAQDSTYSSQNDIASQPDKSRAVTWEVLGWSELESTGTTPLYRIYGSTAHVDNGKVLSTFHYTRTYLGLFMKCDSGRVWGNYTVTAPGGTCIYDVLDANVHYVKYGTTSD